MYYAKGECKRKFSTSNGKPQFMSVICVCQSTAQLRTISVLFFFFKGELTIYYEIVHNWQQIVLYCSWGNVFFRVFNLNTWCHISML